MIFTDQIVGIKDRQEKVASTTKDILSGCKKLEKDVKKIVISRLQESFPNTKFDWKVSVMAGWMTNRWTPEVFFYAVEGYQLSNKGFWFEDTIEKFEKVKAPINTKKLVEFLKALSKELGIKCRLIRYEPYWVTERAAARLDSQFGGDDL